MPTPLSGPGVGLPPPQALYPASLANSPFTSPTDLITLAGGEAVVIPAGDWFVEPGPYGEIQFLDPVTGIWRGLSSARATLKFVKSDGFNMRVANPTGCPVAAVVTTAGSSYSAAAAVTATGGNSTWLPIIGGLVSTTTTVSAAGSGYGIAPIVHIAAPPTPGVQATGHAVLSSGSVSSIVIDNQGAGYPIAPAVTLQANPADPNLNSIVNAAGVVGLTGAGTLAAVLCTNPGAPVTATPTLTVTDAGGGTSGVASVVMMWTVTGGTIANAGAGYNAQNMLTSVGGQTAAVPAHTNPAIEQTGFIPRPAQIATVLNGSSIGSIGTIIDGGLFEGVPTPILLASGASPTTVASISGFNLGTAVTTVLIRPAP